MILFKYYHPSQLIYVYTIHLQIINMILIFRNLGILFIFTTGIFGQNKDGMTVDIESETDSLETNGNKIVGPEVVVKGI